MKVAHIKNDPSKGIDYVDDKVFLENSIYKTIFGKSYSKSFYLPWKRGVVKVKCNGKTIRRLFHSGNTLEINKKSIGLSIISMQILDVQADNDADFFLSKGNKLLFMWQHPNHLTRIGFKYTLVLGILALVIAIGSFVIQLL